MYAQRDNSGALVVWYRLLIPSLQVASVKLFVPTCL
jgi:hypothetical protein